MGSVEIEEFLEATNVSFDAVLLDHRHETMDREVTGTLAAYAGTTERISRDERTNEPKVNLIDITDGQVKREEIALETRLFDEVTVIVDSEIFVSSLQNELDRTYRSGAVLTGHLAVRNDTAIQTEQGREIIDSVESIHYGIPETDVSPNVEAGVYTGLLSDIDNGPISEESKKPETEIKRVESNER